MQASAARIGERSRRRMSPPSSARCRLGHTLRPATSEPPPNSSNRAPWPSISRIMPSSCYAESWRSDWRGSRPSAQQLLQPFGDLLGGALVGEAGGEPALRVHYIDDRAVIHRVVAAGFRMLRVIHPIAFGRLGDLIRRSGQGEDRGVKA